MVKLIFISGIFINLSSGQSKSGRVNNNVPQNSNWFDLLFSEILYESVTLTTFDIVVFKYSLVRKGGGKSLVLWRFEKSQSEQ